MKILDPEIYQFMDNIAPYLNLWVCLFLFYTIYNIVQVTLKPQRKISYGTMISELPGLPLTLLHTVCFVKGILAYDPLTVLLFAWWGPGFIVIAGIYLYTKKKKIAFNWAPLGYITSITCKINYLIFMIIYYYYGCYSIMLAFSVWIIHDQINLAWFEQNADRTRRTFEDYWLIRLCYVGFLFIPCIFNIPYRIPSICLGLTLFTLWCFALVKVTQEGNFYRRPDHKEFLRNIVYLSKKYREK